MRLPSRALLLTALLFGAPASALVAEPRALAGEAAPTGDKAKAKEWADTAASRFDAGDYAGAVTAMEEAEKHFRVPPFLQLRAQALEKLGRLLEARRVYQVLAAWAFPSDSPPVWFEAKSDAQDRIRALDSRIPKLTIVVEVTGHSVTLDGKSLSAAELGAPIAVDPGEHTVVARSAEGVESRQVVKVRIGASERVTIKSYPGEAASPGIGRAPALAAFGVGAVGLALGAIFGGVALSKKDEVLSGIEACGPLGCEKDEKARLDGVLADSKTFAGVSSAGFVLAGIGAAAGVTLLVIGSRGAKEATPPAVRITLGSISFAGRF